MTYAQLQFVKAEAAFRIGRQGHRAGRVHGLASRHTSTSSTRGTLETTQAATQITAAEKAAFLADPRIVPANPAALTLTQIMTQKYIAQWALGPQRAVDGYAALSLYRRRSGDGRAGLPWIRAANTTNLYPDNGGKIAQRIRPRYNSEYVWNFAALKAIGGDRPRLPHEAVVDHSTVTQP